MFWPYFSCNEESLRKTLKCKVRAMLAEASVEGVALMDETFKAGL